MMRRFCGPETGGRVDVVVVAIVEVTVGFAGTVVSGVVSFEPSAKTEVAGSNEQTATTAIAILRGRIMMMKG